jgi:cell division protein FtsB
MHPHNDASIVSSELAPVGDRRRIAWHAIAVVAAAALAWLVFTTYRQPDLILDLAVMRLC